MLKHGMFYLDKSMILGKLDFHAEDHDIHITHADVTPDGLVNIRFVVSVDNANESNIVSTTPYVRRYSLND